MESCYCPGCKTELNKHQILDVIVDDFLKDGKYIGERLVIFYCDFCDMNYGIINIERRGK